MTAIAERISEELTTLPQEDQEAVLREVRERLHDLRAKKVYDAVQAGEMETYSSADARAELRKKHGLLSNSLIAINENSRRGK